MVERAVKMRAIVRITGYVNSIFRIVGGIGDDDALNISNCFVQPHVEQWRA